MVTSSVCVTMVCLCAYTAVMSMSSGGGGGGTIVNRLTAFTKTIGYHTVHICNHDLYVCPSSGGCPFRLCVCVHMYRCGRSVYVYVHKCMSSPCTQGLPRVHHLHQPRLVFPSPHQLNQEEQYPKHVSYDIHLSIPEALS